MEVGGLGKGFLGKASGLAPSPNDVAEMFAEGVHRGSTFPWLAPDLKQLFTTPWEPNYDRRS